MKLICNWVSCWVSFLPSLLFFYIWQFYPYSSVKTPLFSNREWSGFSLRSLSEWEQRVRKLETSGKAGSWEAAFRVFGRHQAWGSPTLLQEPGPDCGLGSWVGPWSEDTWQWLSFRPQGSCWAWSEWVRVCVLRSWGSSHWSWSLCLEAGHLRSCWMVALLMGATGFWFILSWLHWLAVCWFEPNPTMRWKQQANPVNCW